MIERKDYNKVITIKLCIPNGCNARCEFCYNKDKNNIRLNNSTELMSNFIISLDNVINRIKNKNPVSLDITGGEPTMNPSYLISVFKRLKEYKIKDKVLRVTMTINGYRLNDVIPYMEGVVDYVNISVHDFCKEHRNTIFGFDTNSIKYNELTHKLQNIGITCSACCVIYKKINNFENWKEKFISWAKQNGFISIRFRCNVYWNNQDVFDEYMIQSMNDNNFQIITYEKTPDSHWCRLRRREDGFRIFFLHGVLDTSIVTKGIEYVIADDGLCYCDYYKRKKLDDCEYEIGKIYDI